MSFLKFLKDGSKKNSMLNWLKHTFIIKIHVCMFLQSIVLSSLTCFFCLNQLEKKF